MSFSQRKAGRSRGKRKLIQTATFGVPEYEMKAKESYRPPVSAEHMRRLRALKRQTGKPVTVLVAEALEEYLATHTGQTGEGGE
jgi:hypothetical protein